MYLLWILHYLGTSQVAATTPQVQAGGGWQRPFFKTSPPGAARHPQALWAKYRAKAAAAGAAAAAAGGLRFAWDRRLPVQRYKSAAGITYTDR